MKLLLDTHVFLWASTRDKKLTKRIQAAIASPRNQIYISAATAWEISIKRSSHKLKIPVDLEGALAEAKMFPLNISFQHAIAAGELPRHHDDPFDRLMIAQARIEKLRIVTHDEIFEKYDVDLLPA